MSDFKPKFLQPEQWLSWQRKTHDPDWSEHRYRDSKDRVIMHFVGEVEALLKEKLALLSALKSAEDAIDPSEYPKTIEIICAVIEKAGGQ